ncbi:hypothetical protein KUIN1_48770 [Pseudomonas sp. KUIN-1]|nr:hypothetical protein KUIN1_48770 [Pseudomonas sp. KUIN-1]
MLARRQLAWQPLWVTDSGSFLISENWSVPQDAAIPNTAKSIDIGGLFDPIKGRKSLTQYQVARPLIFQA